MAALSDAEALPQSFGEALDKALAKEGVFEGRHTKEERLKAAKQKELSLWIRTIPGVKNASVLYDRKEGKGLARHDVVTASVSVQPAGSAPLDPRRVRAIKKLVAAAFAGLHSDNVTVADLNGPIYAAGSDDGVGDGTDDPYFNLKVLYEEQLEQDILNQLSYIPGVRVRVSAELDKEISREEKNIVLEPKNAAPLRSQSRTTKNSNQARPPAGAPGLASQGGPASGPVSLTSGRESTSEETTREEETQNAVPSQHTLAQIKGMTPKRVRASVVVPTSYYRAIWKENNKPADGSDAREPTADDLRTIETAERKNIAGAVAPLLATLSEDEDPTAQVAVTTFQSLSSDPMPTPALTEEALAWLGDHWGTLTTAVLAFFSLLMLRSMIKSVPSPEPAPAAGRHNLALVTDQEEATDRGEEAPQGTIKRRFAKGPSYKDDLAAMVREDPDAAATILRAWIAGAG